MELAVALGQDPEATLLCELFRPFRAGESQFYPGCYPGLMYAALSGLRIVTDPRDSVKEDPRQAL